ncbi:tryptophan--tRNA ligase [Patescibacteria group bacterium]|nr:tryptophan--tRNA ligase [Patescibacteria group bacterium]MBU4580506.1 tryptophan--tRNA ligase [Patescibacteria group bacterium]
MTKQENKQVFSGIRSSGELHLGNYIGAIKSFIELQKTRDCVFMIVDYHGITTPFDPKEIKNTILNVALDYLAAGIDPNKSILAVQSNVPEHLELSWIFSTITPVGLLQRIPTFKEKIRQHPDYVNLGLLSYPVLMAADILIYKAGLVPVGEDQLPHIEFTNETAKRFNNKFGKTFPEVKAKLSEGARIMSLNDPAKKMSKSLGPKTYIALNDSPETIKEKMKKAVTDIGTTGKMTPATENLFLLLKILGKPEHYEEFLAEHKKGTIKYSLLKETLAADIADYFAPFRAKRKELEAKPEYVKKILADGADRARKIARATMREVKEKIGLMI